MQPLTLIFFFCCTWLLDLWRLVTMPCWHNQQSVVWHWE